MKKVISFSLWGTDPKYTVGAIKNAELASIIYPDWEVRFYCASCVPLPIIFHLSEFSNTKIIEMNREGNWTSMFWRFLPAGNKDVDVLISRDTDSRLSQREKEAVDEWLNSDFKFHIMRDHPWHGYPVLGGMWGVKGDLLSDIDDLISNFSVSDKYGTDYEFFNEISHRYRDVSMVHDEFFSLSSPVGINLIKIQGNYPKNFPTKRIGAEYVGKPYDSQDNPDLPKADLVFKI